MHSHSNAQANPNPVNTAKGQSKPVDDKKESRNVSNAEKFYKTRLCPYKDRCKKMSRCTYAHHASELKQSVCLNKTRLCEEFKFHGICKKGQTGLCNFAHSTWELHSTVDMFKARMCLRNACQDINCRHAHIQVEIDLAAEWIRDGVLIPEKGCIKHVDFFRLFMVANTDCDIKNQAIEKMKLKYGLMESPPPAPGKESEYPVVIVSPGAPKEATQDSQKECIWTPTVNELEENTMQAPTSPPPTNPASIEVEASNLTPPHEPSTMTDMEATYPPSIPSFNPPAMRTPSFQPSPAVRPLLPPFEYSMDPQSLRMPSPTGAQNLLVERRKSYHTPSVQTPLPQSYMAGPMDISNSIQDPSLNPMIVNARTTSYSHNFYDPNQARRSFHHPTHMPNTDFTSPPSVPLTAPPIFNDYPQRSFHFAPDVQEHTKGPQDETHKPRRSFHFAPDVMDNTRVSPSHPRRSFHSPIPPMVDPQDPSMSMQAPVRPTRHFMSDFEISPQYPVARTPSFPNTPSSYMEDIDPMAMHDPRVRFPSMGPIRSVGPTKSQPPRNSFMGGAPHGVFGSMPPPPHEMSHTVFNHAAIDDLVEDPFAADPSLVIPPPPNLTIPPVLRDGERFDMSAMSGMSSSEIFPNQWLGSDSPTTSSTSSSLSRTSPAPGLLEGAADLTVSGVLEHDPSRQTVPEESKHLNAVKLTQKD